MTNKGVYATLQLVSKKSQSYLQKRTITAISVIVLFIAIGGIILTRRNHQLSSQLLSITPTSVPATTSNPTPTDKPSIPGWKTYLNQMDGYSINYPEQWFNLGSFGISIDHYFSNENVGAPLDMKTDSGIWVTIRTGMTVAFFDKMYAAQSGVMPDSSYIIQTKISNLTINGQQAVKYTSEPGPKFAGEYAYETFYLIKNNAKVYSIDFLTQAKKIGVNNASFFDQMASSFKLTGL